MKQNYVLRRIMCSARYGLLLFLVLGVGLPVFGQGSDYLYFGSELSDGIIIRYDALTGNALMIHKEEKNYSSWDAAGTWAKSFGDGWRLPLLEELMCIATQSANIDRVLRLHSGTMLDGSFYWTDSEFDDENAWWVWVQINKGIVDKEAKNLNNRARAVRSFNVFTDLTLSEPAGLAAGYLAKVINTIACGNDPGNKDLRLSDGASVSYSAATIAPSGTGNLAVSDADFADYAAKDYTLAETSELLNKGNASVLPADYNLDLAGEPRTARGSVDPGAWQVGKGTHSSVYHTVTLTVAPGIWCDYRAGDLTIADGDHLYLQFHTEDITLSADDILFLIDGAETAFKISDDGRSGSYILNPITEDHTVLIAQKEYTVTMPEVDGAVTDPAAGVHKASYGEPFRFTLSLNALKDLNEFNEFKDLKVYANDTELTPRETGQAQSLEFTIDAVEGPTDIRIEGINPTGNAGIAEGGISLSIVNYQLSIVNSTGSPIDVTVYNITGKNVVSLRALCGSKSIPLPAGIYIVEAGTEVHKVVVN